MLAIAANMLLLASCNREQIAQSGSISVNYQPVVGNSAQNVAETKSNVISSTDGSLEIPFNCVVSEQMGPQKDTKGTLYNYNRTGSTMDLEDSGLTQFEVQIFKDDKTAITTSGYETVTYSSSKWTGTTLELPEYSTGDYEFFAQANKTSSVGSVFTSDIYNVSSDGFHFEYIYFRDDCRKQVDYLIGYYKGTAVKGEVDANIQFIHPLTSVIFKKGDIDGVSSIKRIEIIGTYNYCNANVEYDYDTGGNLTADITWSVDKKSGTDDPVFLDPKADANPKVLEVNNTTKVLGEPFILIPQNLEDDPVTINVYAITTTSDIICLSTELGDGEWESGKTYTYTLGESPKPTITKTGSDITGISAVAGTYTTATGLFSLENAVIGDVTASSTGGFISDPEANADGSITFTITKNANTNEREAGTITLSVAGGNHITFNVTQNGKPYIDYANSGTDNNIIYVSAAADTYTTEDAVFSLKNGAVIGSVAASSTGDITFPTANSNGTITYTVTANTSNSERTVGTIKLTYSDGDYIEFTVKQLAASSSITLWEGVYTYSTTDTSAKFGGSSSNSFKSGVTVSDITGKKLYVTTDGTGWINNAFILPGHNDPWHIQGDAVAREGNLLYMTRGMTEDEATALLNGGLGFNAGNSAQVTKIEVR